MSREVVEVVAKLDFGAIDGSKYPMIVQEEPRRFEYEDNVGYNIGLMTLDSNSPLYLKPVKVKLVKDEDPQLEVGDQVRVEYDEENSTLYASTRQGSTFASVEISLKVKEIKKATGSHATRDSQ